MNKSKISKISLLGWPVLAALFGLFLIGITLWFNPGYGFMDDAHNLENMSDFWSGKRSYGQMLSGDIHSWGRFRPLYYVWVVLAYAIQPPVFIYLGVLIAGLACLLLWGRIIAKIFPSQNDDAFSRYIYPAVFFAFTPFWNIFMYISVQEKLVFFFGTVAVFWLIQAYEKSCFKYLSGSLLMVLCAIASKETGLALIASLALFALLDLIWFRLNTKISAWLVAIAGVIALSYMYFIRIILGGYTAGYKSHMNISSLLHAAMVAPMIIKAIAAFTLGTMALYVFLYVTGRHKGIKPFFLLMGIIILAYLTILLPWCFANYLMAPLGPFVGVMGYLYFKIISEKHKVLSVAMRIVVIALIAVVFIKVVVPRISKMADKRKIIDQLVLMKSVNPQAQFFYPPSMMETYEALKHFSGASIEYADTITETMIKGCGDHCYIIVNDEAGYTHLKSVAVGNTVYASGTWVINRLKLATANDQAYRPDF